ncbi:50S ribosomal protein L32 [Candidatus Uhrbacteria bacterium]|nr:50S ribosomal protein L32 [Candidatus Uhrbacteria bacterium]
MVVRMRANRSKTGKRRSHAALLPARLTLCECGAMRAPHRACAECGKYNGRVVIDVVARALRQARRAKRREKELKASGQISESKKEKETVKS